MTIKSIQKVIKVGSSLAITIPAKEAAATGIKVGDYVDVTIEPINPPVYDHSTEVVALTQKLITRHQQALKNLSQR